jgi:hypothetical protein
MVHIFPMSLLLHNIGKIQFLRRAFVFFVFNPGFQPLRGFHPGLCCSALSALSLNLTRYYACFNLTPMGFSPDPHVFYVRWD